MYKIQLIPKHQRGKRIFQIEKALQDFANTPFGKFLTDFGNAQIAGDSGAGAAAAAVSGFKYNQEAGKWMHESAPEYYEPHLNEGDSYKNAIIIDKGRQHLFSYDENGKMVFNTPVSTGKNPGPKQKDGDYRTPTGKFSISRFEGNRDPKIFGAPEFWRLNTPGFSGFGIHGDAGYPELIGQPASHGCVRMPCDSIASFQQKANPHAGQTVYILDENGKY